MDQKNRHMYQGEGTESLIDIFMFIDVGGFKCSDGSCGNCSSSSSISGCDRGNSSCCSGTDNGRHLANISNSKSGRDAGAELHARIYAHDTLVPTYIKHLFSRICHTQMRHTHDDHYFTNVHDDLCACNVTELCADRSTHVRCHT